MTALTHAQLEATWRSRWLARNGSPSAVKLFATPQVVKDLPVWDVYVGGTRTGQLRLLNDGEAWTPTAEWGYFSLVAHDNFQWASFTEAKTSLENFHPRTTR